MTTTHLLFTRPGEPSAKTARQAGAPNHHQNSGSGEIPMISAHPDPNTAHSTPSLAAMVTAGMTGWLSAVVDAQTAEITALRAEVRQLQIDNAELERAIQVADETVAELRYQIDAAVEGRWTR